MDLASLNSDSPVVRNKFPDPKVLPAVPYRIAIIGEAPGKDEVAEGEPFVGASGRVLNALMSRKQIMRSAVFVGNVCQHRPPDNDIRSFDWNGPEFTQGKTQLAMDLAEFQPNICVLTGKIPLNAFHPKGANPLIDKSGLSIDSWRGSLFQGNMFATQVKCIGTFHPAATFRTDGLEPLIMFDLKRAREEGESPELVLPQRTFDLSLTAMETIGRLDALAPDAIVSIDIEGGVHGIPCISFTDDPFSGFIVAFAGTYNSSRWTVEEEIEVWRAVKRVLEDSRRPKVLQNSLYDRFVLAYTFKILIRNVRYDTMLMHWEMFSELEKNLGLQTSIYTREPYYKSDRKSDDLRTFFEYCCKDSAVTLEIQRKLKNTLGPDDYLHCEFNHAMLNPFLYMELRGLKWDTNKAIDKKLRLELELEDWQSKLNEMAGTVLNVKSAPQKKKFLYETLGLPPQYARKKRGETERKLTTNDEALMKLRRDTANPALELLIQTVRRRTILSMLKAKTDEDGRVRGSYSVVGSETGRTTCRKSPTGSGMALQTVPDENELYDEFSVMSEGLRDLVMADEGHDMCQVDLSGADNWTVAAHAMRLGDPTMMNDLLAGIKPAKVLVLMFRGITFDPNDRGKLKILCDSVSKSDPLYFGGKQTCHGSNYGMKPKLISDRVFIESDGEISLTIQQCTRLQNAYFQRYPGVLKWQSWVQEQVKTKRQVKSATGHTRRFFGNPYSEDTYRAAYSDEPQQVTTYSTNRSVLSLWRDPANRIVEVWNDYAGTSVRTGSGHILTGYAHIQHRKLRPGSLVIEPLHQVHDAFICQWPQVWRDWARARVRLYTAQELIIADQRITIPGEGHYGPSWGEQDNDL